MKTPKSLSNKQNYINPSPIFLRRTVIALAIFGTCFVLDWHMCRAEHATGNAKGVEVLTRGPVHEAFAGIVTFNPEQGVEVRRAPPEVIEELPPDERPEGNNVTWIPGYWAWDDERSDFLWMSGVWRALPPGRQWMAGYWGESRQGFQWTSGYWADATVSETVYLPAPPATVEMGPNIAAPSADYVWAPGCWVWHHDRYAWRPGYWVAGRSDWNWSPSYYVWTPRGHVFVEGYWDYPVARRGVLFAPVYFESHVYAQRGYYYSPSIVINLNVFHDHLFLRPSYHHYYFGDYYAPSYSTGGFYASFSFQSRHHGYDPIYSHRRWEHRQDRDWEHRVETTYHHRRDHEDARPPRTWAAQTIINTNINNTTINNTTINTNVNSHNTNVAVATPFSQLSKKKDGPMRFQPVAKEEKQQIVQRSQEVRKSRDERRTIETKSVDTTTAKPGKQSEPTTVKRPKSPIVAKSPDQLEKDKAPPAPHKTPNADSKVKPDAERPAKREAKPETERPAKRESAPEAQQPQKREAKPETERPSKREAAPAVSVPDPNENKKDRKSEPLKTESKPEEERPLKREAKPETERPAKRESAPEAQQPQKREAKPETERPSNREAAPAVSVPDPNVNKKDRKSEPFKTESKPEEERLLKREAKPETERPAKRESAPEAQQPQKREAKPETERPSKREAPPETQQPPKREAAPEAQQPAEREGKPDVERPAREKQGESDKGETRREKKDPKDKDEEQKVQ